MHFSPSRFSPSRYFPLLIAVAAVAILAGCGKKGDLYLPATPAAPVPTQPVQK
jgi:predicted small lipoprotein YifL